jgi:MOSC domain-containing protein YiiM
MKLLSVNVSSLKTVILADREIQTGIFKEPVEGRVKVRKLGLDSDVQVDRRFHGGLDKAVYCYPFEHYATWSEDLGLGPFPPGQFGENLTVEGMLEDTVSIGDIFRVGEVLLEVSEPRSPCFKLALKFGLLDFPKPFLASGRVGFYFRVVEEGTVGAGDSIELVQGDPVRFSVREMSRLLYLAPHDVEGATRALEIKSLSARLRHKLNQRVMRGGEEEPT